MVGGSSHRQDVLPGGAHRRKFAVGAGQFGAPHGASLVHLAAAFGVPAWTDRAASAGLRARMCAAAARAVDDLSSPRERRTLLQEPQEMLELRFIDVVGTLLISEEQRDILGV